MPYYLGFIAGEETSQWPCSPECCVAVQVNVCLCGSAGGISVCVGTKWVLASERGVEKGKEGQCHPHCPLELRCKQIIFELPSCSDFLAFSLRQSTTEV